MSIERMEKEQEKKKDFVDVFLNMFGGENGLIDFQIIKADRDNSNIFKEIMMNETFERLDGKHRFKQGLLEYEKACNEFLKKLYAHIKEIED